MSAKRLLGFPVAIVISTMLLSACTSGKLTDLRDVPVSQITLAEPLVAEAKLAERINTLRDDPSKRSELAGALAEQSMVHRELQIRGWEKEAKQAATFLDPDDRSSHWFFLTRRALCFALNADGQHGGRLLKPLLEGKWSDLDKAQIYTDLAEMAGPGPQWADYAFKGLDLRLKEAGPNSLEVAESLSILDLMSPTPIQFENQLCEALQLPKSAVSKFDDLGTNMSEAPSLRLKKVNASLAGRRKMYFERAAQIQEKVLGPHSLKLADSLAELGESEKLRAVPIYERNFGEENFKVSSLYTQLVYSASESSTRYNFARKSNTSAALQSAGRDPLKRAYVYLKNSMPDASSIDANDGLTVLYRSLGGDPPSMVIPVGQMSFGASHWLLDQSVLSISVFDQITADNFTNYDSDLFMDRLWISGFKGTKEVFSMELPTWGGEGLDVMVIGKGLIRFSQKGADTQGQQEVDYQWNGKRFEAVAGKPSIYDSARVAAAIEETVNGQAFYGLRGHHAVDHDFILNALNRSNAAAKELDRQGYTRRAAQRLRVMFELTSDLIAEASTGSPVLCEIDDSKDDTQKWIKAWTCKNAICTVNLTEAEWRPFLNRYLSYREQPAHAEELHVAQ